MDFPWPLRFSEPSVKSNTAACSGAGWVALEVCACAVTGSRMADSSAVSLSFMMSGGVIGFGVY